MPRVDGWAGMTLNSAAAMPWCPTNRHPCRSVQSGHADDLTIGTEACDGDRCRVPGRHQCGDVRHVPMKLFHVAHYALRA